MKSKRRRGGRGVLVVLALLLAASGALRLGSGVGAALARGSEATASSEPLVCPEPPLALAEALGRREARVATQEAAIAERMAALALADQTITSRLEDLAAAEAELSATISMAEGAAEGDLDRLTRMYETMKPKEAASLFDAMAPEFAAGFLGRMKPELAASVLAGMQPDRAYALSLIIASRNSNVPTE